MKNGRYSRRSLAVSSFFFFFFSLFSGGKRRNPVRLRSGVVILNCSGKLASIKLDSPSRGFASLSVWVFVKVSRKEEHRR